MKKLINYIIVFLLLTINTFASEKIETGKTFLKSITNKSLTKKETISFLNKFAVIIEDERGDGEVTYVFDNENYFRYKGIEVISTDAWRFSNLGALRLFNKDIKMTWKIKISDKENLINIKTKFDPVGKLYNFSVMDKSDFLNQIEEAKLAEKKKQEAAKQAEIEKKKKQEQEKLEAEQKLAEEKKKLEEERLATEQKLEEEKRKLEEERLAAEQKLEEEKKKLEEEKLALQKELEELKKKKAKELEQSEKTPAQIKKEERERKKQEKLAAKKKAKEEKEKLKQEKLAAQKKVEEKKYLWQGKEVSKDEYDRLLNDLKRRAEENESKYKEKIAKKKNKEQNKLKKITNAAYESKMCIMSLRHPDLAQYKASLLTAHNFVAQKVLLAVNSGAAAYTIDSYIDDFRDLHYRAMTTATSNCERFPY